MAFSDGKNLYVVECKSGELKNKRVSFDVFLGIMQVSFYLIGFNLT